MSDHNRAGKAQEPPRCSECGGTGTLYNAETPVECDVCEGHGVELPDPPAPSEPLPVVAWGIRWASGPQAGQMQYTSDEAFAEGVGWSSRLADHEEASHRIADATERAEKAEALVEQWQDASGLVGGKVESGDPGDVTPEAARRYWEGVEAENAKLRNERDEYQRICHGYADMDVEYAKLKAESDYMTTTQSREVEAELAKLRAEVERIEAKRRAIVCAWCGDTIEVGYSSEAANEDSSILADVVDACREHDRTCAENPLRAERAEKAEAECAKLRAELDASQRETSK